jgi:hypothetical protein
MEVYTILMTLKRNFMKYISLILLSFSLSAFGANEIKCAAGQTYDLRSLTCKAAVVSGISNETETCALCKHDSDVVSEDSKKVKEATKSAGAVQQ